MPIAFQPQEPHSDSSLTTPTQPDSKQVEALLTPLFGPVHVAHVSRKLNYKSGTDVWQARITASGSTVPSSVFIKALSSSANPTEALLFTLERANYEFLMRCGFTHKPRIYGSGPQAIVLEDLGRETRGFSDVASAELAVAEVLADLHANTIGLESDYHDLLQTYGIADPPARSINFKTTAGQGWAVLSHILTELGRDADAFNRIIERFAQAEPAPEWARGFIHDDIAQGRQAVICDAGVRLVDFERARFGNIFVDPARIMLGEACLKGEDDATLISLNFSTEFLSKYLEQLQRNMAAPLPAPCKAEFGRVSVLIALELIGDCVALAEAGRFDVPLNLVIASICARLIEILEHLSAPEDLAEMLCAIVAATQEV